MERPSGCACCPTQNCLQQSPVELEFARSACAAALNNDLATLRRRIDKNPNTLHMDGTGRKNSYTPLHYAARAGNIQAVQFLINARASVHAKTPAGATPLHRAVFAGHADVCLELLRAGACLDDVDADGVSCLEKAQTKEMGDFLSRHVEKSITCTSRPKFRPM